MNNEYFIPGYGWFHEYHLYQKGWVRNQLNQLPRRQGQNRSEKTGAIICTCGKGYGSERDGMCNKCRYSSLTVRERKRLKLRRP